MKSRFNRNPFEIKKVKMKFRSLEVLMETTNWKIERNQYSLFFNLNNKFSCLPESTRL